LEQLQLDEDSSGAVDGHAHVYTKARGVLRTPSSVRSPSDYPGAGAANAGSFTPASSSLSTSWLLSPLPTNARYYAIPSYGSTADTPHAEDLELEHAGDMLDAPIHFAFKRGGKFMDWVRAFAGKSLREIMLLDLTDPGFRMA